MKNIKYVLCPGWFISKNDNEEHYVCAKDLSELYGVNLDDCLILNDTNYIFLNRANNNLKFLTPKENGEYEIKNK